MLVCLMGVYRETVTNSRPALADDLGTPKVFPAVGFVSVAIYTVGYLFLVSSHVMILTVTCAYGSVGRSYHHRLYFCTLFG